MTDVAEYDEQPELSNEDPSASALDGLIDAGVPKADSPDPAPAPDIAAPALGEPIAEVPAE
jgi:hypothetical protein